MTIKRFNQTGVASNVQFGRRGGQVAMDWLSISVF